MNGLFIGLTTLDLIYLTDEVPLPNQKKVALDQLIAAGGPATNAAIAFSHWGNQAVVLSVLGKHPLSEVIRQDLGQYAINIIDLQPELTLFPPVSSIIVTQNTGERAVLSINATKTEGSLAYIPDNILDSIDILLIDGHQMQISLAIAQQAKARGIPIVIDGGSWKAGFEAVLALGDYVICSEQFLPPVCETQGKVMNYLRSLSIPHFAISCGAASILYSDREAVGEIAISPIPAIDTLGAGDILHGAFCHFILQTTFIEALKQAAKIASLSCQFLGTRQWMETQRSQS
jgi:sugar/nucleoside kinase (ribokinase family)